MRFNSRAGSLVVCSTCACFHAVQGPPCQQMSHVCVLAFSPSPSRRCGNMAEAIARGIVRSQTVPAAQVIASNPSAPRREIFRELGCVVTSENSEVVATSDIVFLCVKPQVGIDVCLRVQGCSRVAL
jgi:NADP oxidoreductase coenzyme F420-dependent